MQNVIIVDERILVNLGAKSFETLEQVIEKMPPSMVEYFIDDAINDEQPVYFNHKQTESAIVVGNYTIIKGYDEHIYVEHSIPESVEEQRLIFYTQGQ
ncbi:MAG: hypothetical protein ACPGUI_00500 [Halarcobacter sp.]